MLKMGSIPNATPSSVEGGKPLGYGCGHYFHYLIKVRNCCGFPLIYRLGVTLIMVEQWGPVWHEELVVFLFLFFVFFWGGAGGEGGAFSGDNTGQAPGGMALAPAAPSATVCLAACGHGLNWQTPGLVSEMGSLARWFFVQWSLPNCSSLKHSGLPGEM